MEPPPLVTPVVHVLATSLLLHDEYHLSTTFSVIFEAIVSNTWCITTSVIFLIHPFPGSLVIPQTGNK